jgi:hypothetical protein
MKNHIELDTIKLEMPDSEIHVTLSSDSDSSKGHLNIYKHKIDITYFDSDRNPTSLTLNLAEWIVLRETIERSRVELRRLTEL